MKKYYYHVVFQCDKDVNFSPLGRTFVGLNEPIKTSKDIMDIEETIETWHKLNNVIIISWREIDYVEGEGN